VLIAIFVVGYIAIVLEHTLRLNKAAAALITGVLCWTAYVAKIEAHVANEKLAHHMGDLSQILFFLLAAMTIVEVVDAHEGFDLVTSRVVGRSRRKLVVVLAAITFFLSAVLDNLTTSIVMMSLVRKLAREEEDRMQLGAVIIVAANAGGAWSPIGDVTTTMLWVGGQITTAKMVGHLLLPSLVSAIVPVGWIALRSKGDLDRAGAAPGADVVRRLQSTVVDTTENTPGVTKLTLPADAGSAGKTLADLNLRARTGATVTTIERAEEPIAASARVVLRGDDVVALSGSPSEISAAVEILVTGQAPKRTTPGERNLIFFVGVAALLFVPVFKTLTHLPPVMGILLGLGVLWAVTELAHKRKADDLRGALTPSGALQRVDAQSVLFFLGILLAITALESDGVLQRLATWMGTTIRNADAITVLIGLASSVVDNVPLVAGAQGMYSLADYPTDHRFWHFLAYCAGTGGSILIIGSAAGVAVMGMENISFGWYFRRISLPALAGYAAGAITFLLMS